MFDILGRGVVKVGEAAGIVDEQPTPEEVEVVPQPVPEPEAQVITIKQIGLLKPVVKNPLTDLEVLAELFGMHKGEKKVWNMECPNCEHEEDIDAVSSLTIDSQVTCSECDHTDEAGAFYEGSEVTHSFSRTPTSEEVYLATGNFHAIQHGWEADLSDFKKYYLYLLGKDDGKFVAGGGAHRFYQHCSDQCKRDDCRCSSPVNILFGTFQPLQQRMAEYAEYLAEQEDD